VLAEDHYWLDQPIGPDALDNRVARFYPYGSTADGTYPVHHGVEFVNPMNTPIRAAVAGTVVFADSDTGQGPGPTPDFYGNAVVVRLDREYHGQPVFYLYGHIDRWLVKVGQHVETGQVIAEVGMAGIALGPHLHLEVRVGQNDYWHTRNPELWVRPLPGFGNIAGRLLRPDGMPISQRVTVLLYQAATPDEYWRETETYGRGVNPDDGWGENFLFGDVPAGNYIVRVKLDGQVFSKPVRVEDGKTAFVFPQIE
jgi:murein DD-endopeptidase MepM/ murein hydrolase activator NlpD